MNFTLWYLSYHSETVFRVLSVSAGVSGRVGAESLSWLLGLSTGKKVFLSVWWDMVLGEGNVILCLVTVIGLLDWELETAPCGTGCALNPAAASTDLCHTLPHSIYRWQNQRASSLGHDFLQGSLEGGWSGSWSLAFLARCYDLCSCRGGQLIKNPDHASTVLWGYPE